MDSLMTMELRNKLRSDLGVELPVAELFGFPTGRRLVELVAQRLQMEEVSTAVPAPSPHLPTALEIDQMSDAEVEEMLRLLAEEGPA
jgi:hypothetical protein